MYQEISHRKDPINQRQCTTWCAELGSAVNALHAEGIMHRDLKPDNVFIANDRSLRLGDLGLAKVCRRCCFWRC
jgi:NIMA (never in mitosis gene a)-related kinase